MGVLREGGNAVDASIAAGAVSGVVLPQMGGLGGDLFMQVVTPGLSEPTAINACGAAPAAATIDRFGRAGFAAIGAELSTVPGAVDGWSEAAQRFGSRSLRDLLTPAIAYAEEGFIVDDALADWLAGHAAEYAQHETTSRIFMPEGRPLKAGEVLVQKDLARTLLAIAEGGRDAFYRGEISAEITRSVRELGGLLCADDLSEHASEVVQPLRMGYRGTTVYEQPPPSQGYLVLQQLKILEGLGLRDVAWSSAERFHMMIEAKKLAFADRDRFFGDVEGVEEEVRRLLSSEHADDLRTRIDSRFAATVVAPRSQMSSADTTYLAVADAQGGVVSYIHSLFGGNAVVAGTTGVMMNDRLKGFSLDPRHPNALAPRKRPTHTLNTYVVFKNGTPWLVGGSPGGHAQVQTNVQIISALVDFDLPPQVAIESPRFRSGDKVTGLPSLDVFVEARAGRAVLEKLAAMGHHVTELPAWSRWEVGSAKVIQLDRQRGTLTGAADPRRSARASGW